MNSEKLKYEKPLLTNLGSITKHTLASQEVCEWTGGSGEDVCIPLDRA